MTRTSRRSCSRSPADSLRTGQLAASALLRHHRRVAPGGFKTVQLNLVGWSAVVAMGLVAGTPIAIVTGSPAPSLLAGVVFSSIAVRLADEGRNRRRFRWIPVLEIESAAAQLELARVRVLGCGGTEVDGRHVEYVAVPQRDASEAEDLVGLPRESRRAQRRWRKAMRAAAVLPRPHR